MPASAATLRIGLAADITSLDPHLLAAQPNLVAARHMFESLVDVDAETRLIPGLAVSWRPLDALWLNHNWHLTHHKHPTVPWIHLPGIGRAENPQRGFLPAHYARMWRGPRKAHDHVENRYAGRVIR